MIGKFQILLISCLLFLTFQSNGQLLRNGLSLEMEAIAKRYNLNNDEVFISYKIVMKTNNSIKSQLEGQCRYYKHFYRSRLGETEVYYNDSYSFFIDKQSKVMVIDDSNVKGKTSTFNVSDYLNTISRTDIKYLIFKNGKGKTLRIYNSEHYYAEVDSFDILYNEKSYQISQMNLYYNPSFEDEIISLPTNKSISLEIYFNKEERTVFNAKLYYPTIYLQKNTLGKWDKKASYSNYQFINNLN